MNYSKFQEGGAMEGLAPAPQGGGDPVEQLLQMATQALQEQNPKIAFAACEMLVQLASGGGAPATEEEPVFRRGGIISYRKKRY